MTEPSNPRTCSRCGTTDLTTFCPVCTTAFDQRQDVGTMTPGERVTEFRAWGGPMEIAFDKIHQRIEELVGRPVWTHELGISGMDYLEHEIMTGQRPTLVGVLAKIPANKIVIPVGVDD